MSRFLLALGLFLCAGGSLAQSPQPAALDALNREVWQPFVQGVAAFDDARYLATRSRDFVMVDGRGGNFLDYDYYAEDSAQAMQRLRDEGTVLDPQVRFEARVSDGEYASERGLLRMRSVDAQGQERVGYTRFHAISRKETDGRWRVLTEYRWREDGADQAAFDALHAIDDLAAFPGKPASAPVPAAAASSPRG